jgi:hypothetical protein
VPADRYLCHALLIPGHLNLDRTFDAAIEIDSRHTLKVSSPSHRAAACIRIKIGWYGRASHIFATGWWGLRNSKQEPAIFSRDIGPSSQLNLQQFYRAEIY